MYEASIIFKNRVKKFRDEIQFKREYYRKFGFNGCWHSFWPVCMFWSQDTK